MKSFVAGAFCLFVTCCLGCGKASPDYTPPEQTPEQQQQAKQLSKYRDAFRRAFASHEDYVQLAVLDEPETITDEDEGTRVYTRVLVLHREVLDLDDYGLSMPGKASSEDDADRVEGFFNELMFWIDADGNVLFDDYGQPPHHCLVAEWCVDSKVSGGQAVLHFGGNPCLTLNLGH